MKKESLKNSKWIYLLFAVITFLVMCLCICIGSVNIPFSETLRVIGNAIIGTKQEGTSAAIILTGRLPRVFCVTLTGAALSLSGAVMQGLLKNPLADGSTLGVSSGASLGAVIAIALGISFPALPFAGSMIMAILFAFLSLLLILGLSYRLDGSFSSNTIILIGVIFSMFVSGIMSIIITFFPDRLKSITFWTMGSLQNATYESAIILAVVFLICSIVLLSYSTELNAFAIGEENAGQIGVNVRRTKFLILICVSVLTGVSVAIGGTISFVGLVTPHMVRFIVGPNHKRLLPASMFSGAVFLLLADLLARTLCSPLELPIGVVTSIVGAVAFVIIFYRMRKR